MADIFNKEQSQRIFGFIAAGSSLGAIFGPTISLLFANRIGSEALILISSSMLFIPMFIALMLGRETTTNQSSNSDGNNTAIGGNFWDGFVEFLKPPILKNLLFGIGIFIVLSTGLSTFVYFAIKNMLILAISPILWVVVGLQVVRRAGEYAITKPAREMLFTTLDRESRFKGKSVIDVVVYRAGDIFWAWSFTGLTQGLGLTLGGVAAIGSGVALMWAYLGYRLGSYFDKE